MTFPAPCIHQPLILSTTLSLVYLKFDIPAVPSSLGTIVLALVRDRFNADLVKMRSKALASSVEAPLEAGSLALNSDRRLRMLPFCCTWELSSEKKLCTSAEWGAGDRSEGLVVVPGASGR